MKPASAWMISTALAIGIAASASARTEKFESVLATPVGISLQPLGAGQGVGIHFSISGGALAVHKTAYGDARGMTLYTYAKDEPGISNCYDECAKANPPATAPAAAKPFGEWSVIKRSDGTKQWARKGQPLYSFAGDKIQGSVAGMLSGGGRGFRGTRGGDGAQASEGKPLAQSADFKPAYYEPEGDISLPRGISIEGIPDANGRGLVDVDGKTVYAFSGDANKDKPACAAPCASPWKPLASPQISFPTGDFTVIVRNDGINQWAYKGAPLYTFEEDRDAGYAKGIGVDKRWRVALVSHYPLPSGIKLQVTPGRGLVWANAQGLTLYRREAVAYHTGGGHSLRRGVVLRPGVGRQVGLKGCDARCEETMRPVLAPANAEPSGYWETMTRPDGGKQWAYRGFAMYTCACDKKPGDMNANDHYDIFISTDPNQKVDIGTPQVGTASLYWLITEPY